MALQIDCGIHTQTSAHNLRQGFTQSCECLHRDSPAIQDMTLKGSVEGKTYIGPGPDPAGADDREVVSFDGRMLILRWVDPEVAGRYGTAVLVRCRAEGTQPTRAPAAPPPPPPLLR